jgi:hypothetical protein
VLKQFLNDTKNKSLKKKLFIDIKEEEIVQEYYKLEEKNDENEIIKFIQNIHLKYDEIKKKEKFINEYLMLKKTEKIKKTDLKLKTDLKITNFKDFEIK